jgi:hypothetical protein
MAYPRREIAKTCGSVAVTATSSVAVANNPARLELRIKNSTGGLVYLKFATAGPTTLGGTPTAPVATATAASYALSDGQEFITTSYTGPVAIIAPGAVSVSVLEI